MKRNIFLAFLLAILLSQFSFSQSISKQSKKEVNVVEWVDSHFNKGKLPPFSFIYGDKHSKYFIKSWKFSVQKKGEIEKDVVNNVYTWTDLKSGMQVVCDLKAYPEFKAVEWVLRFANTSNANSATLQQVKAIDIDMQYPDAGDMTLHYSDGSNASRADFHPRKKILTAGESFEISPVSGRSSDHAFPFFNIESSSHQGVIFAVGWTGTWFSKFDKSDNNGVSIASGMKELETFLYPNEVIRTPSVCLLFWKGKDRMAGHNAFRRFVIEHQTRKINGKPAIYPVSTGFNFGDPAPCNEYTCLTTEYAVAMINRNNQFGLVPDVFWLDAGWYEKANDLSNNKFWYNTVGNWKPDKVRFPQGLKPISDAAHRVGAKFMVWFEPERVSKDSDWGVNLRKWMLEAEGADSYLYNLGNKEALEWLCKYIGDFMEENGVDYYRQDFNMAADNFWKANDEPGRIGISEIRHIEGLYAYWDYLLERFPEAIIDNCASGGRRLDFETTKRSAPLWRTDYQYGEPIGYQTHTYSLNFYLPLTGTGVQNSDKFTFRSNLGTSVIHNWKITDSSSSFTEMQRCMREFKELRPYYYEDYYPLTCYDDMTVDDIWLAYQLHRPSDDTGAIVAFRRDKSPDESLFIKLSAVDTERSYQLINKDTEEIIVKTGVELKEGFYISLKDVRSSLILMYQPE